MSPFKLASSFTPEDVATLHTAIVTTLTDAVERSAGLAAANLKGEKKTGLRVHGKTFEFHTFEGAGHAFFATNRPNYRPEAALAGWSKIWDFLGRYLSA